VRSAPGSAPSSPDAEVAIDFYQRAFGGSVVATMPAPDGKLIRVEMDHNGAKLYFADRGSWPRTPFLKPRRRPRCM
jgi:uncharacterized glyoxalase superfamily protein PhnB